MSHAKVTEKRFSNLYTEFRNTYNGGLPPIVMYYKVNDKVCVYMDFQGICFETTISYDMANQYLTLFTNPIQLTEHYG